MKHLKVVFLLLSMAFVAFALSTFFSMNKETIPYEISGELDVLGASDVSVRVYISNRPHLPRQTAELDKVHRTHTVTNGFFQTQFPAQAHSTIYLFVKRPGFLTRRLAVQTAGNRFIQLAEKILVGRELGYMGPEHDFGNAATPVIYTYEDRCGQNPNVSIPQNRVQYVERLRMLNCDVNGRIMLEGTIVTDNSYYPNLRFSHRASQNERNGVYPSRGARM